MSERQPEQVPINLVEAIDQEAPLVSEIRRAARVLAVANRALEAYGVELVPTTEVRAAVDESPNVETVGMDEASQMIVNARLEELKGLQAVIAEVVVANEDQDDDLVSLRVVEYIEQRRRTIKAMAARGRDD